MYVPSLFRDYMENCEDEWVMKFCHWVLYQWQFRDCKNTSQSVIPVHGPPLWFLQPKSQISVVSSNPACSLFQSLGIALPNNPHNPLVSHLDQGGEEKTPRLADPCYLMYYWLRQLSKGGVSFGGGGGGFQSPSSKACWGFCHLSGIGGGEGSLGKRGLKVVRGLLVKAWD